MKCYLINLDRAPERLERMDSILSSYHIEYERVAAVDGQLFTSDELKIYREATVLGKPSMTAGDIACGATHLHILKMIADGPNEYAVVMEDDLHLSEDIKFFLQSTNWIPPDADIIKLETIYQRTLVDLKSTSYILNRNIVRLRERHWGTGIYVISKKAAAKIIRNFTAGMMCIDQYIFDEILNFYSIYQVSPALAVQDSVDEISGLDYLKSSISVEVGPICKKLTPKEKYKRELRRLCSKSSEFVRLSWIFITRRQIKKKIDFLG